MLDAKQNPHGFSSCHVHPSSFFTPLRPLITPPTPSFRFMASLHSLSASARSTLVSAFVDGALVTVRFDNSSAFSSSPSTWTGSSPSHVACHYADGFSFAAIITFRSSSVPCFVLSRDWTSAERAARHSESFALILKSFSDFRRFGFSWFVNLLDGLPHAYIK